VAYRTEHPEFAVTVKSGFISDWQWAVHAVVAYRGHGFGGRRREIEDEARNELMSGIARESRRGRAEGARTVVVLVEGDRELAGFFRGLGEREPRAS
jgi:hypothetical protein